MPPRALLEYTAVLLAKAPMLDAVDANALPANAALLVAIQFTSWMKAFELLLRYRLVPARVPWLTTCEASKAPFTVSLLVRLLDWPMPT